MITNELPKYKMTNWFECKVVFDRAIDSETMEKVREVYLVDALSFAEAENRITEEMTPFIYGEFLVDSIKRQKYVDRYESDLSSPDRYFKAKIQYVTLDEKSGKEKKTSSLVLVHASTSDEALRVIEKVMSGTTMEYSVPEVKETPILDVFEYSSVL